tara:strand:+ start:474 stop:1187 length:714 start_codon:yes stop_codon:yes gene_type:complete
MMFVTLDSYTQVSGQSSEETKLYYRSEYAFGGFLHTRGFGLNFRYSKNLTGFTKLMYGFELSNMRHEKQQRIYNPSYDDARGYYLGKLNSLAVARFNIGRQKVIFGKEVKNGVQINYLYQVGATLGFVAPVYLEIIRYDGGQNVVTERYDPELHNVNNIYGRSSFIYGVQNLSLYPGGHAKFAFNFEYSPEDELLKALEVGVTVDGYYKSVPIMAYADNHQFWYTFYVNFQFGKKLY